MTPENLHDFFLPRVHRVALTGRLHVSEQRAVDLIHAAGTGATLTLLPTPPPRDPRVAHDLSRTVLDRIATDIETRPAFPLAIAAWTS